MLLPIPYYEDEYTIDPETGEVWSNYSKRIITPYLDKRGYPRIRLWKNGKGKSCGVHRIVYMAVYPEDDINGYEIDHIDGNSQNNHWENLRKCSRSENTRNVRVHKDNKLGYKNIRLTNGGTYQVEIMKNGKRVFNKSYNTLEEAIHNRDIQLQIHHGDFAKYT